MTCLCGDGPVKRSKDRTTHMWVQDCMKVDARVEELTEDYTGALNDIEHLEDARGKYDCSLTKGWVSIDLECDGVDIACLTHQHQRVVAVLRRLGTKYKGADGVRTWHYFACPTRHGFEDCDLKCRDARGVLDA